VISSDSYYDAAPGHVVGDATIVPVVGSDGRAATASHAYRRAGTYPVTLTVTVGSTVSEDNTTVVVR
jgi:PKD repeat protein